MKAHFDQDLINNLFELVEKQHAGCDDNSCDIGLALRTGYDAVAIVQFGGSGAADNEFYKLYKKLPSSYTSLSDSSNSEYMTQIDGFKKHFISKECPKCNSVCREEHFSPESCDSCLASLKNVSVINYDKRS